MKKLSYLLSILLVAIFYGCKEQEQPYVGYIVIERAVLEAAEGSTTTLTADTDIPSEILLSVEEGADWCTVSASGKTITVKATQTNPDPSNYPYSYRQCKMWLPYHHLHGTTKIRRTKYPAI